jgi:asparagine synthase (glutamine-hydrolysing)
MAMRPFYYRVEDHRVLFGSEVKQILAAPGVPREIFEPMVAMHLCGRFDRLDWTFFEGIAQLEPAHALVVTADGAHRTWRYWDMDPDHQIRYDNEQEYVEHFREIFKEAVRSRLRSHKPVGLFLSGGLDSGSIASMAGHLKETEGLPCPDFRTYSHSYATLTQCDERHISDQICARYDLPATYIDAESVNLIGPPDGVPDADEPFMGPYKALIAKELREVARDNVGAILSGHRGDLLIGNWIFNYVALLASGKLVELVKEIQAHEDRWPQDFLEIVRSYIIRPVKESLDLGARLPKIRYIWRWMRGLPMEVDPFPPWVKPHYKVLSPPKPSGRKSPNVQNWARYQRYKVINMPLHMRTAVLLERRSINEGLKATDPWTDVRLTSFVTSIPQAVICSSGENKKMLREAVKGIMPEGARQKSSKVNPSPLFRHAVSSLGTSGIMRITDMAFHRLSSVHVSVGRKAVQEYVEGKGSDSRIWQSITLSLWLSNHNE